MRSWLDRSHNDKNSIRDFPLHVNISNATGLHVQRIQRVELKPNDYRFLGWTSWKFRFNTAYRLQKKHLFVQKSWGITTSSKQTRSFYLRIEIKTPVILRMLFAYMSPESIRTHWCSRISILISVILNSLLRILSHVVYSSHSAYYVWLCSFLKLKTLPPSDLEA